MASLCHSLRGPSLRCGQSLIRRFLYGIDVAYHMRTFRYTAKLTDPTLIIK